MARSAVVVMSVLFVFAASAMAAEVKTSASFELSVPGMIAATFHACEGLGSESAVIEYRDGTTGEVRKLPGPVKYGDVTLKRGVIANRNLAAWRELVEAGVAEARKNGTIVVYDKTGRAVARWNFVQGWPSKLTVELDPETGLAVETLVLTLESIARE